MAAERWGSLSDLLSLLEEAERKEERDVVPRRKNDWEDNKFRFHSTERGHYHKRPERPSFNENTSGGKFVKPGEAVSDDWKRKDSTRRRSPKR